MKLLKHSIKARILWLLASCAALLLSSPLPGLHAQQSRDEVQSTMRWEHSDDGLKQRIEMRGKAEFTDDYTDIKSVSEGQRTQRLHREERVYPLFVQSRLKRCQFPIANCRSILLRKQSAKGKSAIGND